MSFSLQIGDQGLVEFGLSSWIHLILIGLCYAFGLCNSFKNCALLPSLLFHALFLSPVRAHNVASTIFWRDNQKTAGPWERKTVQYPSPLDSQAFIFHVSYNMQQQYLSVDPPGWVTDTQCLLEVHLLVASLQGQLGLKG